jgi:hypothetical protein
VPEPPLVLKLDVPVLTMIDVGEADAVNVACADKATTDTFTVVVVEA